MGYASAPPKYPLSRPQLPPLEIKSDYVSGSTIPIFRSISPALPCPHSPRPPRQRLPIYLLSIAVPETGVMWVEACLRAIILTACQRQTSVFGRHRYCRPRIIDCKSRAFHRPLGILLATSHVGEIHFDDDVVASL